MDRKWLVSRTNPDYIKYLSKAVSVSPAFAQVLVSRGIKTPQAINDFLNPHISGLSDPFEIDGVKTAVERIKHAADTNETVLVHGDYDADGLTATAIMVHALRTSGIDVHYFIPDRIAHGYGFNPVAVEEAKRLGATLIITVDCGITSFDAAACAKKEGIDVIITDHHEPAKSKIQDTTPLYPPLVRGELKGGI
ncbi:MAG: DHH family phosphoesterase, partial [Nitrospirota bacterium]